MQNGGSGAAEVDAAAMLRDPAVRRRISMAVRPDGHRRLCCQRRGRRGRLWPGGRAVSL